MIILDITRTSSDNCLVSINLLNKMQTYTKQRLFYCQCVQFCSTDDVHKQPIINKKGCGLQDYIIGKGSHGSVKLLVKIT